MSQLTLTKAKPVTDQDLRRVEVAELSRDTVFVRISSDGTLRASGGPTTAWCETFARYHRIRFDQVGNRTISTVFLGVADRQRDGSLTGAFETTIFGADGLYQELWRWNSLQEARAGHEQARLEP
jgi:hypothetical protein